MRRYTMWLIFVTMTGMFILSQTFAFAQSNDTSPVQEILVLQDSILHRFGVTTTPTAPAELAQPAQTTTLKNVNLSSHDLVSLGVDPSQQFLYTIRILVRDQEKQPRPTLLELVQTNLTTSDENVLMTQPGLFQFVPSPDGQHLLVTYFESGARYGDGWLRACVLDIKTNMCNSVKNLTLTYYAPEWLDDNRLIMLSHEHNLYVFDATTQSLTLLPVSKEQWFIGTFAYIPRTTEILLSTTRLPVNLSDPTFFLVYDLQTEKSTELGYTALTTQPYLTFVDRLLLSPDGRYLLYAGLDKRALVDFETGQLIAEFDNVFQASWLKDGRSLLMYSPQGVQIYDAVTQQAKTLMPSSINTIILS